MQQTFQQGRELIFGKIITFQDSQTSGICQTTAKKYSHPLLNLAYFATVETVRYALPFLKHFLHHIILHKNFLQALVLFTPALTSIVLPNFTSPALEQKGADLQRTTPLSKVQFTSCSPKIPCHMVVLRVVGEDKNPGFESCKASDLSAANKLLETL